MTIEPLSEGALPINLEALLEGVQVEWERLEFKAGWNPLDILHCICAFANDFHNLGGGYILIGIEEQEGIPLLPPPGLETNKVDAIQKELLELCYSSIQPAYHPLAVPYLINKKIVLVLWIPGGQTRPYKAKTSLGRLHKEYAYYIRKNSSTVVARGQDETELLSLTATVPFDDRFNHSALPEDLSYPLIRDFLESIGSELARQAMTAAITELLGKMNLLGGPPENPFPRNVGLLFFCEDPRCFFPATQIDVVFFPKGDSSSVFIEKTFFGPLNRLLSESLEYIRRNYLTTMVIKLQNKAEALRAYNYPYEAIEETIVNAIYHRSYEIREPVEVRIYQDRMVVLSYPGPEHSVRMESLRRGQALARRYRNRRIGEFLKELKLTEGRSTGIPKILRTMAENGSPPPLFDTDDDRSYFQVTLPMRPLVQHRDGKGTKLGLSRDQAAILTMCLKENDLTSLITYFGRTNRTKFRDQVLKPLIEIGYLAQTIPNKPTSPMQKYLATPSGCAAIEAER